MVDQLEVWTVRGRVATARRKVRDALVRLAADSEELADAMADAELLDLRCGELAGAGAEPVR